MPALAGVEHKWVDVGGFKLHYAEAGTGDPVILVHGWPQHWYAWRKVIGPLAEHYRVIAMDLRGYGWSDAPPKGYGKPQFGEDIAALMDALGIEKAKLIGHDWGGFGAFLLALQRPERVDKLLVLSITHPWVKPSPRGLLALPNLAYMYVLSVPGASRALLRRILPIVYRRASETPMDRDAVDSYLETLIARPHVSTQTYRTFTMRDSREMLGGRWRKLRLKVPTRLIAGTKDPVVKPHTMKGWESYADDMGIEWVEGVGHMVPEEAPELVVERALELFATD
jgi:pimeloyl-ACP methyl ester carboxylesterase